MRHGWRVVAILSALMGSRPSRLSIPIPARHAGDRLARLSQFLTRYPRKWLILSPRYGANGLRLSPQIDFDRGRFGVVVALVKTSRDDGGSVEPAPRVE